MPDPQRGTDRIGRRAQRFLSPSQKYEIWLQLLRGETTVGEAADRADEVLGIADVDVTAIIAVHGD